jgi:SagB-type dehydrogenase family enzyme
MTDGTGYEFMQQTQIKNLPQSGQRAGLPQPPLVIPPPEGTKKISLPSPEGIDDPLIDLRKAIEIRRTLRRYSQQSLTLSELSILLWLSQGVQESTNRPSTLRTVPSAGARHAFETSLLINRVDSLSPGLYHYAAIENALYEIKTGEQNAEVLSHACLGQRQVLTSAVTFFWIAVAERMQWRYPERGYRYMHLDAGHVCQNLYLVAEALGCGVCAIAAYDDDLVNKALDLDGKEMFAIYIASLGKRE